MSQSFRFYDSWRAQRVPDGATPELLCALDRLNQAARGGSLQPVALSGRKRRTLPARLEGVIGYTVHGAQEGTGERLGNWQ